MAIFRGIGGAGDSTTDATVTAVTEQAVNAATSATQAASSASSAASSASSASTSATNAAASASTASDAATAAQTAQTNAETAETNAETAQAAAEAAQTAAETAETNAETAETNAETAEANAVIAKNSAEAAQTAAETAETNAETAYANTLAIFGDAQDVQDAVDNAETAYANTLAIFGDAQDVQDAVDSASASAATATTKASEASASASNASTSETNALNSATSANTSATNASNSATAAAGSATDANTYKLAAQDAQVAAEAAQSQTENLFDQFGDQYLGSKASDPTVDNDGDPLTTGDIYWNSTSNTLRFYNGTAWVAPETIATNAATAAQTAQTAAETAQTAAETAETNAETAETNAETAETNAAASASSASTSATNAANSATAASNSATAANNSASAAATSATNAENAYDSFDDRYLGVKASDPALDNDGAALLTGALYFNSTDNEMRVYTGSVWIAVVDLAGDVTVTSLTASSVDINGGTIDGVTIGGASAGAGTFTTLQANTSLNVDGTVTADGLVVDGNGTFSATTDVSLTLKSTSDTLSSGQVLGKINFFNSDPSSFGPNNAAVIEAIAFGGSGHAAQLNFRTGNTITEGADAARTMSLDGNGDISFYEPTGTTPKLFWDASTERLGIGTTSPTAKIEILNETDATLRLQTTTGTDRKLNISASSSGNAVINVESSHALEFHTNNTERLRIDYSGNVGIGTTSPASKLDVSGTITSTGATINGMDVGVANGATRYINTHSDAGRLSIHGGASQTGASLYLSGPSYGAGNEAELVASNNVRFVTGVSEAMRIDSSGRLGIGTTAPATKLVIASDNDGTAENNTLRFWDTDTLTQANQQIGKIEFYSSDTSSPGASVKAYIGAFATDSTPDAYLAFATAASASATERMRIDSSGNVGIGTTTPSQHLEVSGSGEQWARVVSTNASAAGLKLRSGGSFDMNIQDDVGVLKFSRGSTEQMRIDSFGRLGIGTTSPASPLQVDRASTDGNIVTLSKDGTTVGSIASYFGSVIIGDADTALRFNDAQNKITPRNVDGNNVSNTIDLGDSTSRFKDLYLSGGVYLGGTGAANLLDDYEEGDWTPEYAIIGGSFSAIAYNTFSGGSFTKIGNMVTLVGYIATNSFTIGTGGNLVISGLPFTPLDTTGLSERSAVSIGIAEDWAASGFPISGRLQGGTSSIFLQKRTSVDGTTSAVQASDMGITSQDNQLSFSVVYFT